MNHIRYLLLVLGIIMMANSMLNSSEASCAESWRNTKKFQDKVVIVTGASRGIGRGIAELFSEAGANLVLIGRDESQLNVVKNALQNRGGKAICVQADVSHPQDMERMVNEALARFGRIDILCHNAGIFPHARLENMTLEEWQHVIDVNLTGTFLAVKACLPAMKAQRHGKIVITSSISGPQTALPGFSHYTASKGGVAGFIKTAAVELAKYNININGVEPGNIMTEGFAEAGEEHINNMIRAVPLGRLGTPKDIACAMMFLASEDASYITGQNLIVDGGQTLPESHFSPY